MIFPSLVTSVAHPTATDVTHFSCDKCRQPWAGTEGNSGTDGSAERPALSGREAVFSGTEEGGTLGEMQGAGIRQFSGSIEVLDLPGREELGADELLIGVHAAGVGNWDNFARVGQWDLGRRPPMALGVEAAGVVRRVGPSAGVFAVGDRVLAHCAPFRDQGAWAEEFLVPVAAAALLPETVPFDEGAAFPVPALTADQVLEDALAITPGQVVLVNGAGGVTGTLLVQLAAHLGAEVIATASANCARLVSDAGAKVVVDYRSATWAEQVRGHTAGRGVDGAVNAVPGGAAAVLDLVKDGGRLATITSDPPDSTRGVEVHEVYVSPDGARLERLTALLAAGELHISVGVRYPLEAAAEALSLVRRGAGGNAVVLAVRGA